MKNYLNNKSIRKKQTYKNFKSELLICLILNIINAENNVINNKYIGNENNFKKCISISVIEYFNFL